MSVKTIQNNRKKEIWEFVTNERARNRLASSVNFKGNRYRPDFLRITEMVKNKAKMNSMILVGQSVLDDLVFNESFRQWLESIQTNAAIVTTGAIRGTLSEKFFQ